MVEVKAKEHVAHDVERSDRPPREAGDQIVINVPGNEIRMHVAGSEVHQVVHDVETDEDAAPSHGPRRVVQLKSTAPGVTFGSCPPAHACELRGGPNVKPHR